MTNGLEKEFRGERLTIVHCDGAMDSLEKALTSVPHRRKTLMAIHRQITTLGNMGRLSGENFPKEGNLPNGSNFYALKRIPLRGYCWFSSRHPSTVYISHYIHKKKSNLDTRDSQRVVENWRVIEE